MSTALYPWDCQEPSDYVLLVMDDPFLRHLVRLQVSSLGLPVREGLSVARALARREGAPPTMAFLDLWVDHGQGLAFLEALRRESEALPFPVLIVGEEPREEVRRRAQALGAEFVPLGETSCIAPWLDGVLTRTGAAGVAAT